MWYIRVRRGHKIIARFPHPYATKREAEKFARMLARDAEMQSGDVIELVQKLQRVYTFRRVR